MNLNLSQGLWKQRLITAFFLSCVFSVFIFNTNVAQANTNLYPAQLSGCQLGGSSSVGSTCAELIIGHYNATHATCAVDTITVAQNVECTYWSELNGGNPFTVEQHMFPVYTCAYGGIGGPSNVPYNCTTNTADTILVTNLGSGRSCSASIGDAKSNDSKPYDGNPIHAGIGNKYAMESDFDSTSLKFVRYYNNQQNNLDRHIGKRWRLHTVKN